MRFEVRRFSRRAAFGMAALGLLACASAAGAQGIPVGHGRLSGLAYADYFYNLQGSGIPDEANGFRFRRIYFTYDHDLDTTVTMRLQLEANDDNLLDNGRFAPAVKQACVTWKNVRAIGSVVAGLASTPLWTHSEAVWGYRSVERTILDLRGLGSSSDFGIAMQRTPSRERPLGWHVMFANGEGNRPEDDRQKKLYGSLAARVENVILEGVGDWDGGPGDQDRYTLKIFGAWTSERLAFGLEGFRRVNLNAGPTGEDVTPAGLSVFGRRSFGQRWAVFARYDAFDADAALEDEGYSERLWIGGVDYALRPNVRVIPNLWINAYSAKADAVPDRDTDIQPRLTVYCFFP